MVDVHMQFNSLDFQLLNLLVVVACSLTQSSVQGVSPCIGFLQPAGQRKH